MSRAFVNLLRAYHAPLTVESYLDTAWAGLERPEFDAEDIAEIERELAQARAELEEDS